MYSVCIHCQKLSVIMILLDFECYVHVSGGFLKKSLDGVSGWVG